MRSLLEVVAVVEVVLVSRVSLMAFGKEILRNQFLKIHVILKNLTLLIQDASISSTRRVEIVGLKLNLIQC